MLYSLAFLLTDYPGVLQDTNQQVAIKTVVTDKLSSKLFDNLQSEIQILKSLSHRHITRLIDIVVRVYPPFTDSAQWLSILRILAARGEECVSYHGVLCRRRLDELYKETWTRRRPAVYPRSRSGSPILPPSWHRRARRNRSAEFSTAIRQASRRPPTTRNAHPNLNYHSSCTQVSTPPESHSS
jgi:hypothetical protein